MIEAWKKKSSKLLLDNSWDFTEQKIQWWTNGRMEIGNNNLESRDSTAGNPNKLQLITRADVRSSKTGIGGRGARPRHQLWMELIGMIRTMNWRVLWWLSSTAKKRVQCEVEGKRREFSSDGTCTTWCRVLRFGENNNFSSTYEAAWEEEKVYWTTFSGRIKLWEEKDEAQNQGGVKESATAMCSSNQILSRDLRPKRIATESHTNQQRIAGVAVKREKQQERKLCLKLAERELLLKWPLLF